jgi:UMP-CMP kinase
MLYYLGKGTQCALLVKEFGSSSVSGCSDVVTLPQSVKLYMNNSHPHVDTFNQGSIEMKKDFRAIHLSIGALLRRELLLSLSAEAKKIKSYLDAGQIVPGNITVQLILNELKRIEAEQYALNPCISPVFLIDGFPRSLNNIVEFESAKHRINNLLFLNADQSICQQRLEQRSLISGRSDDNLSTIEKRFNVYKQQTMPIIQEIIQRSHKNHSVMQEEIESSSTIESVYELVRLQYLKFIQRYEHLLKSS